MADLATKDAAVVELKLTTNGWLKKNGKPQYPSGTAPATTHWGKGMTLLSQISAANAAARDEAVANLKKTTAGYTPGGKYWKLAFAELDKIKDPPPAGDWTKVAVEWGAFTLPQTSEVRYGKDTTWITKTLLAGSYTCSNAVFGSDPVPGTPKECQIHSGVTPPPPPPPPPNIPIE